MKSLRFVLLFALLTAGSAPSLLAQRPDSTTTAAERVPMAHVRLDDGSTFSGRILAETDTTLTLRTGSGMELTMDKANIRSIRRDHVSESGRVFYRLDPNRTRLIFAPTGRALDRGAGYVAVYEIFFPFVSLGLTDAFTVSGGVSLIPGVSSQLLYFAPKLEVVRRPDLQVSVGVLGAGVVGEDAEGPVGILYSVGTFGNDRSALSVGLGIGYADEKLSDRPLLMLGGQTQVSNRLSLLTENWIAPGLDGAFLSAGIRLFGDDLAADLALVTHTEALTEESGLPFIPFVSLVYNFGR